MSNRKRTNKRGVHSFGVASTANQALVATGNIVGSGNFVNIANQQFGVISTDHNSTTQPYGDFLAAGNTATQVRSIRFVQGTPNSANTTNVNAFGVGHKAYVQSGNIRRDKIRSVSCVKAKLPIQSTQYFKTFQAPTDLTVYKAWVELRSVRNDRDFSNSNDEVHPYSFETPAYSAIASITNPLSHMLQNLIHQANLDSRLVSPNTPFHASAAKNFVIFGLNISGAGSGVAINTLASGTTITFMTINGVAQTVVADTTLINTLTNAISGGLLNTATIENVNISNAGTAGATSVVNAFLVVALPEREAVAFDNIMQVMPKVDVRLGAGFSDMAPTYSKTVTSRAFEGVGLSRQLRIEFDANARLAEFSQQNHPWTDYFPQAPSYVDVADSLYTVGRIEYYDEEETMTTNPMSPKMCTIIYPATISNPSATAGTAYTIAALTANPLATLNTILGAWLDTAVAFSGHELKGESTTGANFV